jgi:hypothetical protein
MVERNGELHRFLHHDVASEEALGILIFLNRHHDQLWSAEEIRDRLRIAGDATAASSAIATKRIELRLAHLQQKRLVTRDAGRYRYEAADRKVHDLVATLGALESRDLADAASMIYLRPRTGAAAFADAFGPRKAAS